MKGGGKGQQALKDYQNLIPPQYPGLWLWFQRVLFTKSRDTDSTPAPVPIALEDERISSVRGAINTQA